MAEELYFSHVSGYGLYQMLDGSERFLNVEGCRQMQHIQTKTMFYAVKLPEEREKQAESDQYVRISLAIRHRLPEREWVWPVDYVENEKRDKWILFAPDAYPQYPTLLDLARRKRGIDDPQTLLAVSWLLDRFCVLWDNRYITLNFDLANYYFDPQRRDGYICFSDLTMWGILADKQEEEGVPVSRMAGCRGLYDPNGFSEEHDSYHWDKDSFLISVAATLFYLLTGRMPYDGSLQDDDRFDMEQNPKRFWAHSYPYRPYFIADEIDATRNSVGEFPEELEQMARYQRLSGKLKEMFCTSLCNESVTRAKKVRFYTPQEWRQALGEWYASAAQNGGMTGNGR